MTLDDRDPALRDAMAELALGLPGVYESSQWGGWVYKVPDPRHGRKKAKMLCFVVDGKNHGWHSQFKLPLEQAVTVIDEQDWVEEHPWKTLGPSGWVVARPRDKAQLKVLGGLLGESRALLPEVTVEAPEQPEREKGRAQSNGVARKVNRVMEAALADGWHHADVDAAAFDA
ncbi:MAG: hypothetical protein AAGI68_16635 [Planctomycetota bacterium]